MPMVANSIASCSIACGAGFGGNSPLKTLRMTPSVVCSSFHIFNVPQETRQALKYGS